MSLEYEPPRGYVGRSRYRFVLFVTLLNFLLLVAVVLGPPGWRWGKQRWEARGAARAAALLPTLASPSSAPPAGAPTRSPAEQAALDTEDKWMNYTAPADRVVYEERQEEPGHY